ncbi:BglII/BstYI family type II restriction endonuclease [Flavobacterium sp.]|uniref:BglII/BstYI family type II restriction endonuclease n=1 Tax=Flavobacterium sp. TaxID=239 RepID=UPI004033DF50
MNFINHSFRHAEVIFQEPEFREQFEEIIQIIVDITDDDLIARHQSYGTVSEEFLPKSLSRAINHLLQERFLAAGWHGESSIFRDPDYQGDTWRLDFAKQDVSVEVAFNHGSVVAWNLLKPVLASELNHVQKAIQTKIGLIIAATEELKRAGGFDGAIGTYERYIEFLPPLNNILTVPIFIIGLKAPETFRIEQFQLAPRKKVGRVVMREPGLLTDGDWI